ncbi:hypothetical protein DPMN_035023 [Dreissena polymorpha]|uniref:Uncharacterized protein n=1 Tax=Dreissena polymorpha TaxID=45954 RepID=A0A9D4M7W5_DREPO|nr:hypothetical protein DPMN_035023 [Dreissena polymorpha]
MSLYSGKLRKTDSMLGSDRMLRAHHKNAVFSKSLEDRKCKFDITCNKRLSKLQQEICDVYFNEYIPLKEQSNKIKDYLPKLPGSFMGSNWRKLASIPGTKKGFNMRLPNIHSMALVSSAMSEENADKTDSFLDLLRQQGDGNNQIMKKSNGKNVKPAKESESPSSLWDDSDTEDPVLQIEEKRLEIIKAAIALTSQPAKPTEVHKPQQYRRSFLTNLRRESRLLWEKDLLKQFGDLDERREKCSKYENIIKTSAHSEEADAISDVTDLQALDDKLWRSSLSKNHILNSNDADEEEEDLASDHDSNISHNNEECDSLSSLEIEHNISKGISKFSTRSDLPVHNIEHDLYVPEPSPDIYSVFSEGTDSNTSGSSFTVSDADSNA